MFFLPRWMKDAIWERLMSEITCHWIDFIAQSKIVQRLRITNIQFLFSKNSILKMSSCAFSSRSLSAIMERAQQPCTFIISIEMNRILILHQTMDVKNKMIFRSNVQPYVLHQRKMWTVAFYRFLNCWNNIGEKVKMLQFHKYVKFHKSYYVELNGGKCRGQFKIDFSTNNWNQTIAKNLQFR